MLDGAALLRRLPGVRGRLTANENLASQTWFRVGGPAEVLFRPADAEDLAAFLSGCPADIPVTVIGVASNLLIRDGGVPGVVVRLGPAFATIKTEGVTVTAGAAAIDLNVARTAQAAGIAGLEFLSGIPGSIGGGLLMNAGAYHREFTDIVKSVQAITRAGMLIALSHADMSFAYRHSNVAGDILFTSAVLEGEAGDRDVIAVRMAEIQAKRAESQPIREKTGGSTFANPPGEKSWKLIEAAGCRGLTIGGAQMSEKHCNFLINTGIATAADIETLGEEVRRRVKESSGHDLRWEIRRIGIA